MSSKVFNFTSLVQRITNADKQLAKEINEISNCNKRQLYRYLRFYQFYPQIVGALSPQLHFELLVDIDDDTKRAFYEVEATKSGWSVRELKRPINSLYTAIKDPYVFEFLNIKSRDVMSESHLEDQLLDKLAEFLLELWHGFCFEARQKRILIGKKHYFVDIVFYHRILKCHVLVELKLEEFNYENIGQLNTYVNWYKKYMMSPGDNHPIGILLCTNKEHALMEFALAGLDEKLFVSKYQLELPAKEEMQKFIEEKLAETK